MSMDTEPAMHYNWGVISPILNRMRRIPIPTNPGGLRFRRVALGVNLPGRRMVWNRPTNMARGLTIFLPSPIRDRMPLPQ